MKLLYDENLSPRLASLLVAEFPNSAHVREVGLLGAHDRPIWDYARSHGFTIVSKDTDFRERSFVDGAPPKVIWLDVGNAGTRDIAGLLRRELLRIQRFAVDGEASVLMLSFGSNAV